MELDDLAVAEHVATATALLAALPLAELAQVAVDGARHPAVAHPLAHQRGELHGRIPATSLSTMLH